MTYPVFKRILTLLSLFPVFHLPSRSAHLDFLTGDIFQEKFEPPRILSLYLKVWKLRDSQYRIYCFALYRCALNLEFSNCSPTCTSGGTGQFRVLSIFEKNLPIYLHIFLLNRADRARKKLPGFLLGFFIL